MYNKVVLLGRVACDLELKSTPSGKAVTSFTVACDRRYSGQGQERKTDFLRCVAWGQTAEFICRYWSKGKPILLDGEIQTRSYKDSKGVTQYVTEIIAERAAFTGDSQKQQNPAQPSGDNENKAGANDKSGNAAEYTAQDFVVSPTDEDYPF